MKFTILPGEKLRPDEKTVLLLSVISGLTGGSIIAVVNYAIAHGTPGELNGVFLIIFLLMAGGALWTKHVALRRTAVMAEGEMADLCAGIANQTRQIELKDFEKQAHAQIYMTIVDTKINATQDAITIIFCLLYMTWLSVEWTAFVVIIAVFVASPIYQQHKRRLDEALDDVTEKETELTMMADHLLNGFKELKLNQEKNDDLFHTHIRPAAQLTGALRIRMGDFAVENGLIIQTTFLCALGSVVFLLSLFKPVETTFQMLTVLLFLFTPLMGISDVLPEIAKGDAAFRRLIRLREKMERHGRCREYVRDEFQESAASFEEIRLESIRFDYTDKDGEPVFSFGPVTLTLRSGEILFITGGNGSGKSTLMKLLTGLYPPLSGTISMDGKEVSMSDHRHLFTSIFTDYHLFDAIYGIAPIDGERIDRLIGLMKLDHKVRRVRERRFSTLELSTAQQKRLALVVALSEEKPVYVFDEWAAEQDPAFRRYFYEELLPWLKEQGKTVVAVSHDDRYFHHADRRIHLEHGGDA